MRNPWLHALPLSFALCGACTVGQTAVEDAGQPRDAGAPDGGGGTDSGTADSGFAAPHRTVPPLVAQPGTTTSPLTLVTITAANDDLAAPLQDFSDALVQSQWWKAVSAPYGLALPAASLHVAQAPAITTPMTSANVVTYIQAVIADGGPSPNGSTLYLLYIPDGGTLADTVFQGYHAAYPSSLNARGDSYAVVQQVPVSFPITETDSLTITASHEVMEASTDPNHNGFFIGPAPTSPWTASVWESIQSGHIEVGDLCEHSRVIESYSGTAYAYQRIFSNPIAVAGGDEPCLPDAPEPYFNTSVPQDWYIAVAAVPLQIPFIGWSTAPRANWLLNPHFVASSAGFSSIATGGFNATSELGPGNAAPCTLYPGVNNGTQGMLTVSVPAGVTSGDWAVLRLASFVEGAGSGGCYTPITEDSGHEWLVGVYVP